MGYWTERQKELNRKLEKDEADLKKRLSSFYDVEGSSLEKQIASYYQRFGVDSVIQYRKLKESLAPEDRKLLMEQMDEFAEKYPQYEDLMPIRKTIYKLDRLEGLQYSIKMQQLKIGAITNEKLTEHLNRQAMRGINAAAEVMGFGKNFYFASPDIVKLFVNVAWAEGKNFSSRIWENTDKLANYLNTDIAQGFARGDSYEKLVKAIRERFDKVSRNDAYRLIYTEGTYVMAESTMHPFQDDFEEYRVSTVGDGKVCRICRGLEDQTFRIKDRQPGVNFPPLHTWCRCTFEIVVKDWDKWMEDYEKRHKNGAGNEIAVRLGSGESNGDAKNRNRKVLGEIDYEKAAIALTYFSNQIRNEIIENAVVVDNSGIVYQFTGDENSVNIDGVDFKGAYITHNHPESEGIVSFGKDDFEFLVNHPEISELRCCNAEYDYYVKVLKPLDDVVYNDIYIEALVRMSPDEDIQDKTMEILAERGYIQYDKSRSE